jgi:hypothetical protein
VGRRGRGAAGQMAGVSIRPWPAGGVGKQGRRVGESTRRVEVKRDRWTDGQMDEARWRGQGGRQAAAWLWVVDGGGDGDGNNRRRLLLQAPCAAWSGPPRRSAHGPCRNLARTAASLSTTIASDGRQSWQWPVWRRPACPKIPTYQVPRYPGTQVPRYPQSPPMCSPSPAPLYCCRYCCHVGSPPSSSSSWPWSCRWRLSVGRNMCLSQHALEARDHMSRRPGRTRPSPLRRVIGSGGLLAKSLSSCRCSKTSTPMPTCSHPLPPTPTCAHLLPPAPTGQHRPQHQKPLVPPIRAYPRRRVPRRVRPTLHRRRRLRPCSFLLPLALPVPVQVSCCCCSAAMSCIVQCHPCPAASP